MGRKSQFFIIAAVIIILNLVVMSQFVRRSAVSISERPSQDAAILTGLNRTLNDIYDSPFLFKRNMEMFQFCMQRSGQSSTQMYLSCSGGKLDCSDVNVGTCSDASGTNCPVRFELVSTSMRSEFEFVRKVGK